MHSKLITDGTIFIVFDMEWNQPYPGKKYPFDVSALTGEIIEIGAVKYRYDNGRLEYLDEFSGTVKPQKYRKLHYHVRKVTGKKDADLAKGESFEKIYQSFRRFCGEDFILVSWGNSDPDMLKMNLRFFEMDSRLNCFFLDVQPIFSLVSGENGRQRSVEYAVDHYGIEKDDSFHSALADARYEGEIFRKIWECNQTSSILSIISSSSVNPDIKREFTCVGADAPTAEAALELVEGFSRKCPLCERELSYPIAPFRIRKSVYALCECSEHGEMFLRTKIKRNKSGRFYSSSIMRFATQNDYFLLADKQEEYASYGVKGRPMTEKASEETDYPPPPEY